jgi:uncharacterized phage-like protein YoqJ
MPIIPEPILTREACHEDGSVILTVTGHRPSHLGGYKWAARQRVTAFATRQLVKHRPDMIISGMALGWDQATVLAARALNIPYWAAVPFPGQADAWPASAQQLHAELLRDAAGVTIVDPGPYDKRTMQKRNVWMVNRGHQVLALWDGSPSGTGAAVDYANYLGRPVINCWDEWEKF